MLKQHLKSAIAALVILMALTQAAGSQDIKDLPDIKEGLWQSTVTSSATDKPMRTTMCTSNAVSRKTYEDTHRDPHSPCKQIHAERHDSVYVAETECNFNGKVTHSTSTTTVTGNTAFRVEMRKADNTIETVIESKWVGACPAGMKLGDVTGPDGKVVMNMMTP
jgi:hypothetical protein